MPPFQRVVVIVNIIPIIGIYRYTHVLQRYNIYIFIEREIDILGMVYGIGFSTLLLFLSFGKPFLSGALILRWDDGEEYCGIIGVNEIFFFTSPGHTQIARSQVGFFSFFS